MSRLSNITYNIMVFDALIIDEDKLWPLTPNGKLDIPEQRFELFLKSLKLATTFEIIEFWLEFFSKKKMEVLAQEALDDTHLPFWIEDEATKDKWLKWLATLDVSDKKNGEILAKKCYFIGMSLAMIGLGAMEEMEFQSFQNTEEVCFELVKTGSQFTRYNYTTGFLKTISAKRSASYKTKQAVIKQTQIEAIYREHGCKSKGSKNFYIKAMQKTGWTEDYITRKVKEMKNTTRKTDGIP